MPSRGFLKDGKELPSRSSPKLVQNVEARPDEGLPICLLVRTGRKLIRAERAVELPGGVPVLDLLVAVALEVVPPKVET